MSLVSNSQPGVMISNLGAVGEGGGWEGYY
jgi:hypothetical protein